MSVEPNGGPGAVRAACVVAHPFAVWRVRQARIGDIADVPALNSSRPPTPNVEVQRWVLDSPDELKLLRCSLQKALDNEQLPPDRFLDGVPDKMAIVASELATNALTHARAPTVVVLCRTETSFILDVADEDPAVLPEYAGARPPGAGGLGLHLARTLALDLGWYVDGDVKHVWAQFPVPATS